MILFKYTLLRKNDVFLYNLASVPLTKSRFLGLFYAVTDRDLIKSSLITFITSQKHAWIVVNPCQYSTSQSRRENGWSVPFG